MDFEVQRCTRHCSKTERELAPEETFYSVLLFENNQVVRRDYCEQAWEGPPEGALGWWKSKMPGRSARKYNLAPNDILLEYFTELEGQEDKNDVRYVMALLLVRRRIARLEDTEIDDEGNEVLVLYCPRRDVTYRVEVAPPDEVRTNQIQDELAELLFANAS
jgi:hypothetical protein